jgi:hypothetical protein
MLGITLAGSRKEVDYGQLASLFPTLREHGDIRGLFHELREDKKAGFAITEIESENAQKLMDELCLAGVVFGVPVGTCYDAASGVVSVGCGLHRKDKLLYRRARLNWIIGSRLIRVDPIYRG